MSEVNVQKWRTQGREIVILLTGEPEGFACHLAMRAFVRELAAAQRGVGTTQANDTAKSSQSTGDHNNNGANPNTSGTPQ